MKKVIVVDARQNFTADLETRMVLEDDLDIQLVSTLNSARNLHSAITQYSPDILCVSDNVVDTNPSWDYSGISIVGYASTAEGKKAFGTKGIPCYGLIRTTSDLLIALSGDIPMPEAVSDRSSGASFTSSEKIQVPVSVPRQEEPIVQTRPHATPPDAIASPQMSEYTPTYARDPVGKPMQAAMPSSRRMSEDYEEPACNRPVPSERIRDRAQEKNAVDQLVSSDLFTEKLPKKTQVATIYSAKGGIGKSTIASETAVLLAKTSCGRRNYSVCVVDMDIDFGDMFVAMKLPAKSINMNAWSDDIKNRVKNGESEKIITYKKNEVRDFLVHDDETGVYVLLAPISHEDSYSITGGELSVMLRNIVENGGFDFVICDTGPNTRDSAILALEQADNILLVVSQDLKSVNDNDSFLRTMRSVGIDYSHKILIAINCIESSKRTGISVQEIEDIFTDPHTKKPYPCIARIKRSDEIQRLHNLGGFTVMNPKSKSRAEFQSIVDYLTGQESIKPRGFLRRMSDKFGGGKQK